MKKNSKIRNDIILILAIVLVSAVVLTVYSASKREGDYVVVSLNGAESARYSLQENGSWDILSEPDGVNTLVIKDGEAYIEYANCPDGVCVSHRKISKDGESIICLPHKMVVYIEKLE